MGMKNKAPGLSTAEALYPPPHRQLNGNNQAPSQKVSMDKMSYAPGGAMPGLQPDQALYPPQMPQLGAGAGQYQPGIGSQLPPPSVQNGAAGNYHNAGGAPATNNLTQPVTKPTPANAVFGNGYQTTGQQQAYTPQRQSVSGAPVKNANYQVPAAEAPVRYGMQEQAKNPASARHQSASSPAPKPSATTTSLTRASKPPTRAVPQRQTPAPQPPASVTSQRPTPARTQRAEDYAPTTQRRSSAVGGGGRGGRGDRKSVV